MNKFSRRSFMKTTIAAGAGIVLAGPNSHVRGANNDLRFAVVGTGGQGSGHIGYFSGKEGVNVVALCDADRDHVEKRADELEKKLKELAKNAHMERYIKFEGSVYDPVRLGQYYLSSQIFVQPGMGGLAINEAMCFGKPIICSICDGTEKDLVREGFNGIYFKEDDAVDLANKIENLYGNPQLVKQMGLNSVSIIKDEINIHTVVGRYKNAFNSIRNVIH